MNCASCETELEDFLYGELTERRAAEVRSHLAGCSACAGAHTQLLREQETFAQFYEQTAYEPSGEMWMAIRTRLQREPNALPATTQSDIRPNSWLMGWVRQLSFHPALLRQAAFAAALVAVTVIATTFFLQRDGNKPQRGDETIVSVRPTPTPTITGPPPTPVAAPLTGPIKASTQPEAPRLAGKRPEPKSAALSEDELLRRQIARAAREYEGAIRLLDRAIAKRRDTLDPAVLKQYEASLALIDNSILQSRQMLHAQPDDPAARQFLLAAYARKVELMQDIAMR